MLYVVHTYRVPHPRVVYLAADVCWNVVVCIHLVHAPVHVLNAQGGLPSAEKGQRKIFVFPPRVKCQDNMPQLQSMCVVCARLRYRVHYCNLCLFNITST